MPKYTITDIVPCWVTWTYTVEADSEDEAVEKFSDDDFLDEGHGEPIIGDSIDFIDNKVSVKLESNELPILP